MSENNNFLPFIGGGPWNLAKGMITDDTAMALALARSIAEKKEKSAEKLYQKWLKSEPFDIGITTRNALSSKVPSPSSLSNGALMRCSPLAIYLAGDGKDFEASENQILIETDVRHTHSNFVVITAVKSYLKCLQVLIKTGDKQQGFEAAKSLVSKSRCPLVQDWLEKAEQGKQFPVSLSPFTPGNTNIVTSGDGRCMGYIGIAYQLAFYELLHGENFEKSLINAIKVGGDTDTNGCIVGAMLGALYGVESIPKSWRDWVLKPDLGNYSGPDPYGAFPEQNASDLAELTEKLLVTEL